MKPWYKKNYVNRRIWLLENIKLLKLTPEQFLLVSLIDYLNEYNEPISLDILADKSALPLGNIDRIISELCSRNFLVIKTSESKILFSLDKLYAEENVLPDEAPLIKLFESEFKRPLSTKEISRLLNWQQDYSIEEITEALRQASIYQKWTMGYVDAVLVKSHENDSQ